MKRRVFVIGIILAVVLAFASVGFAAWQIVNDRGDAEGEFVSYTIIDLNNITNESTKEAFLYNASGMYSETGLGNSTSFTIQINAIQKDEPYDLTLTLFDYGILNGATIFSIATTEVDEEVTTVSSGNKTITITNISEATTYLVTYNIQTNDTVYQNIYTNLTSGSDEFDLKVTADTENGAWTIDKIIRLTAGFQDLMPVTRPIAIQNLVYNGSQQTLVEPGDGYTLSSNYQQTNAGSYTITVSLIDGYCWSDDGSTNSFELIVSIGQKHITISSNLNLSNSLSFDYNSVKTWSAFKALMSSITFSENGFSYYNIYGMSDGNFLYADEGKNNTIIDKMSSLGYTGLYTNFNYVAGSTYLVYIEITNNNYVLDNQDYIYVKYKTAKMGSNYYTIEDALSDTGTTAITMVGNLTTTENDVQITSFSKIITTRSYSNSSHTLIVPYASANTEQNYVQDPNINNQQSVPISYNACACLYIPNGFTYSTSKPLYITGTIAGEGRVGDHGVIINNGTMTFNSGSSLFAYGYLKGNGIVTINSGITVRDVMTFKDYPGSASTTNTLSKSCFPVFAWVMNSISCKTRYMKGATLECFANIYGTSAGYRTTTVTVIGSVNSTSNCLFVPASSGSSSSDYIEKNCSSTDCNTKFTYNNQEKVMQDINIYGAYEDKALTVSVSISIYTASFATSYTKPMPLSYVNINIKQGKLTISKASYIFLQGTQLTISSGAELVVNGSSYLAFDRNDSPLCAFFKNNHAINKVDAKLVVNGKLSGTGSICGVVETTAENADLQISNYYIASGKIAYKQSASAPTTNSGNIFARYKKYNPLTDSVDSNYSDITSGQYRSVLKNTKYGWFANSAVISYDSNGGTPSYASKTVDILAGGYEIVAGDIPSSSPSKQYYAFTNWTLNGTNPIGQKIYVGVTIVANYIPISYDIVYHDVNGGSGTTINPNPVAFSIETNQGFSNPTRGNLVFGGWYLEETLVNKISIMDGSSLVNYLDQNNKLHLYASWYEEGTQTYTLFFDNSDSNGSVCAESDTIIAIEGFNWSNYTLPVMTGKDNDYNVSTYFDGWYYGSTKITSVNETMFDSNNELTIAARYIDKNELIIKSGSLELMSVYYKPGYTFTVPNINSYSSISIPNGYVFIRWILSNETTETYHTSGSQVTLTDQTTLEPDIRQYVQLSIGSNSYTTVTVTLSSGAGFVVTVSDGTATPTAFSGSTITNGASIYVTSGSQFKAKYVYSGNNNDGKATISGTTPTTNLTTNDQTYTVNTSNVVITPSGTNSSTCLLPDTPIMLYDGTIKLAKDLVIDDELLTYNHITGVYEAQKIIFNVYEDEIEVEVIKLTFDNGKTLEFISGHGLYNVNINSYVIYYGYEFYSHIGEYFVSVEYIGDEFVTSRTKLIAVEISKRVEGVCNPLTEYNINCVANSILTIPDDIEGMWDSFNYLDNMMIDVDALQKDIELYGIYTYEDVQDVIPEYIFDAFNFKYWKAFIGKGTLSIDKVNYWITKYVPAILEQQGIEFDWENRKPLTLDN